MRQAYQWAPEDAGVVEALVDALEAAGKREEAAEVCLERARGMHLPRQASQIEELCGRALELAPECAAARERRVEALAALGRREEAAESALGLAHLREREGALPQAESWVQRARQLVPEHPAARELLFNLLEQSGDAERLQRQVLEEVGDLTALGRRLEALQLLAWGAGKFPDSEAILRRRLELAEQSEDAALVGATLAGLAQLYARRPASPEALSVFAQRARLMPEDRPAAEQWLVCAEALNAASAIQEARQHLVGVLRRAGDRQALLAQLERLIAARPDDLTLLEERLAVAGAEAPVEMQTAWRRELAEAAFRAGLYGKAMEVYGRMAEAEPLAVVWHEQRALCALKLGSPADAVAAYRAGAAKLWEEGRAAEAYGLLARAIALAPAQPALRAEEVELLLALDEPGRAAASLRELSALLAREGSLEKAVAALARAVKLLPDEPALRVELIDLYRRAGMTEAAGEAARAHARSCYEAGRLEEALEMLERAVAVDEHHRPTLLLRIEWLVEAGRKEEAARAALELSQRERQQGQLAEARETLARAAARITAHWNGVAPDGADTPKYRRRSGLWSGSRWRIGCWRKAGPRPPYRLRGDAVAAGQPGGAGRAGGGLPSLRTAGGGGGAMLSLARVTRSGQPCRRRCGSWRRSWHFCPIISRRWSSCARWRNARIHARRWSIWCDWRKRARPRGSGARRRRPIGARWPNTWTISRLAGAGGGVPGGRPGRGGRARTSGGRPPPRSALQWRAGDGALPQGAGHPA
ncbi:hypothetical protein HS125_19715 [bacterium]|nr:hypothetical protein [bacterium]